MNIVKYIIEILKENERVIVPGLGSFFIEYKASTIHPVDHSFLPPSKSIAFDSTLTDDDLLVRTISEQEQISTTVALNYIKNFSDSLLSDIQKGKMAGIEGLGVFSISDDHQIVFVPETNRFSDEEFGLSGFTSPAIVRSEFKDKAASNAQKAKDDKIKRSKRIKQSLIVTAIVLVITALIFLVLFTDIFRNYMYNTSQDVKSDTIALVNEPPAIVQPIIADSMNNQDTVHSEAVPKLNEIKEAAAEGSGIDHSQSVKFYLVAASFKSEENANKSVAGLKAKGYINAGIIRQYQDKGMFIVFYNSLSNQEEASMALKQIIKDENHDSWMLKK